MHPPPPAPCPLPPRAQRWQLGSPGTAVTQVYICGGFNGNECLFTAEVYNTESNQWTVIAPMRSRRSGIGVIAYGEHVYAVSAPPALAGTLLCGALLANGFARLWGSIWRGFLPREDGGRGRPGITSPRPPERASWASRPEG